jgi:hypothetical protein
VRPLILYARTLCVLCMYNESVSVVCALNLDQELYLCGATVISKIHLYVIFSRLFQWLNYISFNGNFPRLTSTVTKGFYRNPPCLMNALIQIILFRGILQWSRGSSVGIATRYGLDSPGIESQRGWLGDFPHFARPTLGPTQLPAQWTSGLFTGGKSGRDVQLTMHHI